MHYFQRCPLDELLLLHRGWFIDDFVVVGTLRHNYKPEQGMVTFHAVDVRELRDERVKAEAKKVMVKNKGNFTRLGLRGEGRDHDHAITVLSEEDSDGHSDSSSTVIMTSKLQSKHNVEQVTKQGIDPSNGDGESDHEMTDQDEAEQDEAEQDEAEQDEAEQDEAEQDEADGPNASDYIESNLPTLWKRMSDLSDDECHFLIKSLCHKCENPSCRRELYLKNWTRLGAQGQPLCFECSRSLLKWQGAVKEDIEQLNRDAMTEGMGNALLYEDDGEPSLERATWFCPRSFGSDYIDRLEDSCRWEYSEYGSEGEHEVNAASEEVYMTAPEDQHSSHAAPVSQMSTSDESPDSTFVTARAGSHSSPDAQASQSNAADLNQTFSSVQGALRFSDNPGLAHPQRGPAQQPSQSRNGWLGNLSHSYGTAAQQQDVAPQDNHAPIAPIHGDRRSRYKFTYSHYGPSFIDPDQHCDIPGPSRTSSDPYETLRNQPNVGMGYTPITFTGHHPPGYQTQKVGMAYTPIPFTAQQQVANQLGGYVIGGKSHSYDTQSKDAYQMVGYSPAYGNGVTTYRTFPAGAFGSSSPPPEHLVPQTQSQHQTAPEAPTTTPASSLGGAFGSSNPSSQYRITQTQSQHQTAPEAPTGTSTPGPAEDNNTEDSEEWEGISDSSDGEESDEMPVDAGAFADDEGDADYVDEEDEDFDIDGESMDESD